MKRATWWRPTPIVLMAILCACGEPGDQPVDDVAVSPSALSIGTKEKGCRPSKVRICHFPGKKNSPDIIEVSSQALQAHLDHGDGLAPPSVRSDADCLVPKPPTKPVSASAITGADGVA